MAGIDPISATTAKITMFFNETELSTGTCFFWRSDGEVYLITNWHNLSGKDNITGKHLSDRLAEPNAIQFTVFLKRQSGIEVGKGRFPLLDESDRPQWLEHPKFGNRVDVVALALGHEFRDAVCLNDQAKSPLLVEVAMDVFIIGYPLGIGVKDVPLWKRGTIASEPGLDVDDLPLLYVDTASTKGMSGSPVLLRARSGRMEDGSTTMSSSSIMNRVVGVYSGRVGQKSGLDAQLGRVWKAHLVDEIIAQRSPVK